MEEAPVLCPTTQSRRWSPQSMAKRRPAQASTFSLKNCLSEDAASGWWCRRRLYQYFSKRLSCHVCKHRGALMPLAKMVWSYGSSHSGVEWSDNYLSRILSEIRAWASWMCPPQPHTQTRQSLLCLQDNQSLRKQLKTGKAECPDPNWTSGCWQDSSKRECVQNCLHCDWFSSSLFISENEF